MHLWSLSHKIFPKYLVLKQYICLLFLVVVMSGDRDIDLGEFVIHHSEYN